MDVELRPAVPDDHERLYVLYAKTQRESLERQGGTWDEDVQRDWFHRVDLEHYEPYVVEVGGRAVGAVYLGCLEGDVLVQMIGVDPVWQGRGVGTEVLRWVARRAAGAGVGVRLWVHDTNTAALRLYLRQGYVESGRVDNFRQLRRPLARADGVTNIESPTRR